MLLPELLDPLVYLSSLMGRLLAPVAGDIARSCNDPRHQDKPCVYTSIVSIIHISAACSSQHPSQTFVQLMSMSQHSAVARSPQPLPHRPVSATYGYLHRTLDFFHCLFEQSCDATNALSVALQSFYSCRGFILKNTWVGRYESPWSSDPNEMPRARKCRMAYAAASVTPCNGTIAHDLHSKTG